MNGAIPSRARCRNGRRHPDPRDAGSLRGLPEKRGSWSVRLVRVGLVPAQAIAPTTTGALWMPRRGTSSACAKRMHSSRRRPKSALHVSRTRPSLGPETRARQSPLNSSDCGASRSQALWRGRFDIAVGQTCASRRNRHRGRNERTERGSPRVTASPRGKVVRDASEPEGGHGLRPCEETRAPVGVRTSWQLQKSAGRVLAPNKLVRSAPKRVAVRVNGGLGEGASGTKVSVTSSANGPLVCRPSSLPGCGIGDGPAKAQDDVRASFSGCLARPKGEDKSSRGTGAVKATGSYEESLPMEGTSGCHEPFPFTRRWSRQPWRLPHGRSV